MLFSMGLVSLQEQAIAFSFLACHVVSSTLPAHHSHCSCCGRCSHVVMWLEALSTGQTDEAAAVGCVFML